MDSTLSAQWEPPWSKQRHEKTATQFDDILSNLPTFSPGLPWCIGDEKRTAIGMSKRNFEKIT